jgi:predicted ATPase
VSGRGARIGNLPSATAGFVGRRAEIAEIRRCLARSRLVTLTGAGGVGKTRLALEVGGALLGARPDGVWFADLAVLREPARVAQTVASAIGVLDASARPAADRLVHHLADRDALLIVDSCEHLLLACAELIELVLRAAPGVHVLATSRETLEITGEHVHAVPPLGDDEAVRLLGERAGALRAGFQITSDNHDAAARLCARLDGNPLAIELAATRLRTLSLPQLVERLDDRFALLSAGSRTAVPRQQTLRALIDWSHALCSPPERLLWARLSVFAGSFDLRAAEAICSAEDLPAEAVLDLLDRLVARARSF